MTYGGRCDATFLGGCLDYDGRYGNDRHLRYGRYDDRGVQASLFHEFDLIW